MKKLVLIIIFLCPTLCFAGETIFYFNSSPGDWIGQGQEVVLTPETPVDFRAMRNYDNGVRIWLDNFNYTEPNGFVWWAASFSAPYDEPLSVGSYEMATRWPFQEASVPGLDISGSGRGCNTLSGRFDVLEVVYSTEGEVEQFAADYTQHCTNASSPPLHGSIRYNSDVEIPDFIPGDIDYLSVLNSEKCVEATGPNGASVDLIGRVYQDGLNMTWSTSTGLEGTGSTFSIPVDLDAVETVTLTLSDNDGNSRSTTNSVCVSDTTPPTIRIISPRLAETYVGNNLKLEAEVRDIVDTNLSDYFVFVGNYFDGQMLTDGYTSLKLAKPDNGLALVRVVATDASGNRGESSVTVYLEHDNSSK